MSKLKELIRGTFAVEPDADAMEFRGRWHSWDQLARIMSGIDAVLDAYGIGPGGQVGVLLRNRPELAAALLSVVSADRCLVTLNPMLPGAAVDDDVRALALPAIAALAEDWRRESLQAAARDAGVLGICVTGDPEAPVTLVPGLDKVGPAVAAKRPGVAIDMLTSGTTGKPKRIPLRTVQFEHALLDAMVYEKDRSPDDRPKLRKGVAILHASLVHIGGMWDLLTAVTAGRQMCLLEKFAVREWHEAVCRHRPRVSSAPPAALRMILDADIPREDMSSLIALRSGAAPLEPAVIDMFMERYDLPVLQNYGATEFAGAVAGWTLAEFRALHGQKRGSVGRLHEGVEGRIVNEETFEPLACGEVGLLELRSSQLGDGTSWVRTTDLAILDKDGYLWIKGRADKAINRGGFKVHPDTVVEALERHPAVREACVVDLPDPRLGAVPGAAVVLKASAPVPSMDELTAFCRSQLKAYEVPAAFRIVDELPRTPSLKPVLAEVRALFAEE